jgi:hypothetical protein
VGTLPSFEPDVRHLPLSDVVVRPRVFAPAVVTAVEPSANLLRVLRTVIRADSDPARQTLFANLKQARLSVRLACGLHERLQGTWASGFVVACYGLLSFFTVTPPRNRAASVLAVGQFENARRQIDRIATWIGPTACDRISTGWPALFRPIVLARIASLVQGTGVLKTLRLARRIDSRHGLLVSCRATRAIVWYACTRTILEQARPGAVLVASDSNPEELGFVAAARTLGIPQVFVSHAYPTPFSPPLDFTLSILEGDAAVAARRRRGPIKGAVLLAGIEGDSVPLDATRFARTNPVIGIFPPKAVGWRTLAAIVDDCRRHFAAKRIIIRWHPSMLERPRLEEHVGDVSDIVIASSTVPVSEVARECDWVVADENSNVHLPVLKLGVPTIAVRRLGLYPPSRADLYGFIRTGVVFPAVDSVCDVRPEALDAFFSAEWSQRFQTYDVSYLHPSAAIGCDVRDAIQALCERRDARTSLG